MKKIIKRLILVIIISLILEIIIFNFGYFRTLLSNEPSKSITYTINEVDGKQKITIDKPYTRVTSILIQYNHSTNKQQDTNNNISYTVKYTVEGYKYYTSLNQKTFSNTEDPYFILDTTDKCINLEIDTNKDSIPNIESITINKPIFNFNLIRFNTLLFIGLLAICISILLNKKYTQSKLIICFEILIIALFIIINLLYIIEQNQTIFKTESRLSKASFAYKEPFESAKALLHNNGVLNIDASDELKSLNNPYDPAERNYNNVSYSYDVSYYNGKYYSYFGLAPIITLVIPLKAITNTYFSSIIYNTIFLILNIILSFIVYKKLLTHFNIKNMSTVLFYLSYFAIVLGSNMLTIMSGRKYDLCITCGIFYILLSILLILSLLQKEKFKLIKHLLLGIALGLIVLSKPSYILYYPILLVLYLPYLSKQNKTNKIKSIITISIPIAIIAAFQMWYNYIRFGNVLEFGAKYQLTNYNMDIWMNFSFGKILLGFIKYLFNLPIFDPLVFPFITTKTKATMIGLNEYTYQNHIIGLIYTPILWILLFKNNILKNPKKEKFDFKNIDSNYKLLLNTSLIIGLLLITLTTCMGGISENYIIDYKLVLCLIASVLWFKYLENKPNTKEYVTTKNKLFIIICTISLILFIPISYNSEVNYLTNTNLNFTNYLTHTFEFWK